MAQREIKKKIKKNYKDRYFSMHLKDDVYKNRVGVICADNIDWVLDRLFDDEDKAIHVEQIQKARNNGSQAFYVRMGKLKTGLGNILVLRSPSLSSLTHELTHHLRYILEENMGCSEAIDNTIVAEEFMAYNLSYWVEQVIIYTGIKRRLP